MIILTREPAARKKGYFKILVDHTEEEIEHKEEIEELFPGLFEEPLELFISEEVLFRRSLIAGEQIAARDLAELMAADELVKAKDIALRYLDFKMRTKNEVNSKLKDSGFSEAVTRQTIDAIEQYGFLDDHGYARLYSKDRIRQRGARVIEHELIQKGIDKEFAVTLLEEMKDLEYDAALAACLKKYLSLQNRGSDDQEIKDKVYRFLISRGYDFGLIKKVYNITLEQAKEDQTKEE